MSYQEEDRGDQVQQAPSTTIYEISGGHHNQAHIGGQFGKYIGTQVSKTYNPAEPTGRPQTEGSFEVAPLITILESEPISLSSRIFRALFHSNITGDRVIAAKITPFNQNSAREAKNHFSIPSQQNIVERIATDTFNFRGQPSIYIAMELCDSNLYDYIMEEVKNKIPFDSEKYFSIAHQIITALDFLHSHEIIHHDLKPRDIFVMANGKLVKLSGFGLSRLAGGENYTYANTPEPCTFGWKAPEVLKGAETNSSATDIFPCGLVFHFVWSHGKHPYGEKLASLDFYIAEGKNRDLSRLLVPYLDQAMLLLAWMLENDPAKRPTTKDILKHKLFTSLVLKLPVLTDDLLCDIVSIAVDGVEVRDMKTGAEKQRSKVCKDKQEITPLGVTTEQLSNAMMSVMATEDLVLTAQKPATKVDLKITLHRAVRLCGNRYKKTEIDRKKTSLGVTVLQLAEEIKEANNKRNLQLVDYQPRPAAVRKLQNMVNQVIQRIESGRVKNSENIRDQNLLLDFSIDQLVNAMKGACRRLQIHLTRDTTGVLLLSPNPDDQSLLPVLVYQLSIYLKLSKAKNEFLCCNEKSDPEIIQKRLAYFPVDEDGIKMIVIAYRAAAVPLAKALGEDSLRKFRKFTLFNNAGSLSSVRNRLAVFTFRPWDFISKDSAKIAVNICHTMRHGHEKNQTEQVHGKLVTVARFQGRDVGSSLNIFTENEKVINFMRQTLGVPNIDVELEPTTVISWDCVYTWMGKWSIARQTGMYLWSDTVVLELLSGQHGKFRYILNGRPFEMHLSGVPVELNSSDGDELLSNFLRAKRTPQRFGGTTQPRSKPRPIFEKPGKLQINEGDWTIKSSKSKKLTISYVHENLVITLSSTAPVQFMCQSRRGDVVFGPNMRKTGTYLWEVNPHVSSRGKTSVPKVNLGKESSGGNKRQPVTVKHRLAAVSRRIRNGDCPGTTQGASQASIAKSAPPSKLSILRSLKGILHNDLPQSLKVMQEKEELAHKTQQKKIQPQLKDEQPEESERKSETKSIIRASRPASTETVNDNSEQVQTPSSSAELTPAIEQKSDEPLELKEDPASTETVNDNSEQVQTPSSSAELTPAIEQKSDEPLELKEDPVQEDSKEESSQLEHSFSLETELAILQSNDVQQKSESDTESNCSFVSASDTVFGTPEEVGSLGTEQDIYLDTQSSMPWIQTQSSRQNSVSESENADLVLAPSSDPVTETQQSFAESMPTGENISEVIQSPLTGQLIDISENSDSDVMDKGTFETEPTNSTEAPSPAAQITILEVDSKTEDGDITKAGKLINLDIEENAPMASPHEAATLLIPVSSSQLMQTSLQEDTGSASAKSDVLDPHPEENAPMASPHEAATLLIPDSSSQLMQTTQDTGSATATSEAKEEEKRKRMSLDELYKELYG